MLLHLRKMTRQALLKFYCDALLEGAGVPLQCHCCAHTRRVLSMTGKRRVSCQHEVDFNSCFAFIHYDHRGAVEVGCRKQEKLQKAPHCLQRRCCGRCRPWGRTWRRWV